MAFAYSSIDNQSKSGLQWALPYLGAVQSLRRLLSVTWKDGNESFGIWGDLLSFGRDPVLKATGPLQDSRRASSSGAPQPLGALQELQAPARQKGCGDLLHLRHSPYSWACSGFRSALWPLRRPICAKSPDSLHIRRHPLALKRPPVSDAASKYWRRSLNQRSTGGGINITPSRIFSIAQKRQQISTRHFQYLIRHQFDVFGQNLGKISWEIFWKWHFSDVMSRDFGSKSGKCLQASKTCTFEVSYNS